MAPADSERRRLAENPAGWRAWGPYLSERAWGTVREDYSADGDAWDFFPHEHARSRTFRWSEDGLAGICDIGQLLCLSMAFWNGHDPLLKERIFGLTGDQGNHGEDAKEYWWYLDATPTHSWLRWRYFYPQAPFPYSDLIAENARRTKLEPEYELIDTGIFDRGYWDIVVEYAKADIDDVCARVTITNAGPDTASLAVVPTLWFRNTWSWGLEDGRRPSIRHVDGALVAEHHSLGTFVLTGSESPTTLFCENETNVARLFGGTNATPFPKDGINDHIVDGSSSVNPERVGTKAAFAYALTLEAGEHRELRLRLAPSARSTGPEWAAVMRDRLSEADAFYASLTPKDATAEEAMIERQAFAGMIWSKQFFHYDVTRWLDGDPAGPTPPPARLGGRNSGWRHLDNRDVISMPDPWEYPWYAAWDLAFHAVTFAHIDPSFAKHQLLMMCREWYMHPNGQLPAYEWSFGDVNPPVHAWAALRVFEIDGSKDVDFLERIMHKLLLNFTWWVNRKDAAGNNLFEGGFLGLDNIGPIDRSASFPGGYIEQSDGTSWMAMYCLNMFEMSLLLAHHIPSYEDLAIKFFEHYAYIAAAMGELWDDHDGFYYDVFKSSGGDLVPIRVRSLVGLISICASFTISGSTIDRLPELAKRMKWFIENKQEYADVDSNVHTVDGNEARLFAVVNPERLRRILTTMLDDAEFLSPHGIRGLSAAHREHPFTIEISGTTATVDYEPAESTSGLFGGNSNWRGPIWFPINYLVIAALRRYSAFFGADFTIEYPARSGVERTLEEIADDLADRLVGIFRNDATGRRPVFGGYERFQSDPQWHDLLAFHEYFHGDTGAGLGASHQTGWTGLAADLLASRGQ